jgi:hypothetical protein
MCVPPNYIYSRLGGGICPGSMDARMHEFLEHYIQLLYFLIISWITSVANEFMKLNSLLSLIIFDNGFGFFYAIIPGLPSKIFKNQTNL